MPAPPNTEQRIAILSPCRLDRSSFRLSSLRDHSLVRGTAFGILPRGVAPGIFGPESGLWPPANDLSPGNPPERPEASEDLRLHCPEVLAPPVLGFGPSGSEMWSSDSEQELASAATTMTDSSSSSSSPCSSPPQPRRGRLHRRHGRSLSSRISSRGAAAAGKGCVGGVGEEAEDVWRGAQWEAAWPRHATPVVVAEEPGGGGGGGGPSTPGGGGGRGEDGVGRARSLTDDDLEELKGCVDLGFVFSYDEIPELCGTLPALELCYSMSQRFLDEHPPQSQSPPETTASPRPPSPPIPNWKISSPGDSPEEVKARLKYWAQAVACTVRLCS
ncbi:hypothetical protein GUJ93_ZPchr0009g151 [Zizania palustris]|uniref:Uncharacterized protein n=1 Tax=Zizania palustris TaxID=103762 RepID=A0A8J5RL04_ZIZPA|nr:hypothetical protein GUJ93_ZPchr0009g151 [Zizania palustris]